MLEVGIALLMLGGLAGFALLVGYASSLTLLWLSLGVVMIGFSLGLPYGIRYHFVLRSLLLKRGALPKRWYVHPTQYHRLLDEEEQQRIQLPFRLGALGFVLILAGCTLATLTLVTRFRG